MECESMLFVKNHIPYMYLWDLSNSFSNSFIDFFSCEGFHQVIYQKEWSIKLSIDNNGGWHETLNLFHVSRCEILHFVTSYMKQNKSHKQTLESAQYGLEISFKVAEHSFSARSCWCNLARAQGFQKTNMPSTERSFYLLKACQNPHFCVIFLYNCMQCIDGFSILLQR